jgi:apolipoprotein N-acyltransferase
MGILNERVRTLDYPLALLSGVLLALSFPRFGHPAFAWISLVPLLVALSGWRGRPGHLAGQPPHRAWTMGLLAGLIYFVGTVYWTSDVVATFGGLSTPFALLAMVLLAAYLALFPAVTALIVARLVPRGGPAAIFFAPGAWVATEFFRGYLFGGFPWVPLGNSQVTVLPVAQLASLLGVYGVSALVVFVNASIAYALLTEGRQRIRALVVTAAILMSVAAWGSVRIGGGSLTREGTPLRVGLVQANIAQEDKWRSSEARRIFTTHIAMTRDVVRRGAEIVLWPESATPFTFEGDAEGESAMRALAREVKVPILFGSDQEVSSPAGHFNAAFLLGPDGGTRAVYRKIHLVPFGEYVPFSQWLSFFPPLVQTLAGFAPFTPGTAVVLLPVGDRVISTAICYEVVYPSLIRQAVQGGSQLLTTITNDGWYGRSSAPFQHFEMASMRAIEQGRYLARAANTGISGIVDPYGRQTVRSAIFEQAGLVGDVRLLTSRTMYSVLGDVIAYAAIALTAVALMTVGRK